MRVLYVEDNDDVRELIVELLSEHDLEVVACASAEAALQLFTAEAFELVLTDVSLPGMKGTELARQLLARQPETWVVFVSGYPMPISAATWGPRVRSLLKPFEAEDLAALLDEVRGARVT